MWKEFKEFAFKGNVLDLAIAVIIGAAFSKIVTALVENIFTPLIGSVQGVDFSTLAIKVGNAQIKYGAFIQAIIDFLLVALVLFLIVKGINRTRRKQEAEVASAPEPSEEVLLLREIRDSLKAAGPQ